LEFLDGPAAVEQGIHVHPVEQRVHVHLRQDFIEIHLRQDFIDIDVIENGVQVDPCHERVNVQRVDNEIDGALRNPLGDRLDRVGYSFSHRP
jgi:hypothetical protein